MIKIGEVCQLEVERYDETLGYILTDRRQEVLLPVSEATKKLREGNMVDAFIYHNSKGILEATMHMPYGIVGDLIKLKVAESNPNGAFLKWGIGKDLFLPRSYQTNNLTPGDLVLVYIFLDKLTGKILSSMILEDFYLNTDIKLGLKQQVTLVTYKKTDLGYLMVINNKHIGLLHYNEVFKELAIGSTQNGFVKKIDGEKIYLVLGKPGYLKVSDEELRIIKALEQAGGFLPLHDKSSPEEIYSAFGISKKTFKMSLGSLYKQRKVALAPNGISLIQEDFS